jgi:hypothetical protein
MSTPIIYHLAIERFRCIKSFSWHPAKGVNVILGGGDVGKTTILDAIGLLLSPTNPATLADTDYHGRMIDSGFVIEGIVSLPSESGVNQQTKPTWPWNWNGSDAVVPSIDGEDGVTAEPVYRLRVRGTEDLELVYEIVQPDGNTDVYRWACAGASALFASAATIAMTATSGSYKDRPLTGYSPTKHCGPDWQANSQEATWPASSPTMQKRH